MDPNTLAPRGALGTALMPLPAAGAGEAQPLKVSRNPAEVLASMMDFPGSVALAELLDGKTQAVPLTPEQLELGERLLDDVRARLDALEPLALKPLVGRRAPELLGPDMLLEVLKRHGLHERRSEAQARKVADELGAPFASALGASLRQAQAHIATLRWEIAHDIRALGPKADRLERIDAALSRAMQAKMGELLDRMEYAAQLTFERACMHALDELPEGFGEAELAGWSEEDGWLGRYRERCVRMTKALFGHLRRGLEGLLRATVVSGSSADARASAHGEDL
jgi:hypothetical protein